MTPENLRKGCKGWEENGKNETHHWVHKREKSNQPPLRTVVQAFCECSLIVLKTMSSFQTFIWEQTSRGKWSFSVCGPRSDTFLLRLPETWIRLCYVIYSMRHLLSAVVLLYVCINVIHFMHMEEDHKLCFALNRLQRNTIILLDLIWIHAQDKEVDKLNICILLNIYFTLIHWSLNL